FRLIDLFFFQRIIHIVDHIFHEAVEILHVFELRVGFKHEESGQEERDVYDSSKEDREQERHIKTLTEPSQGNSFALLHKLEEDIDCTKLYDTPVAVRETNFVNVTTHLGRFFRLDQFFQIEIFVG